MNMNELKQSLDYLVKAELTPFIWGHAGIGKSTAVKQYAKEKGFHFFPFYLGTQSDIGDILGLADFVRDENGTAIATKFAIPEWLRNTIEYCNNNPESGAIIFLDEFNRARRDILNGMFSLALDKTFHTVKLPKNCHVIAAGNPPTDEYFTTDVDETALMARFVHIKLEPTVNEWLDYAKDNEVSFNLINFIKNQPELLEEARTAFELPVKVDRRAYERLNRLMKLKTPDHLLSLLMPGIIGLERTVAYQLFLKETDKPLSGPEVLKGDKFDKLMEWSKPENVMSSYLNITCENLHKHLMSLTAEDKQNIELSSIEEENLMKFLNILPKDIVFSFVKDLTQNQCAIFKKFYTKPMYLDSVVNIIKTAMNK
jgi:hypothetical protein